MGSLLQDVRYGVRMLANSPGFTIVAVLTLALGIGANSAMFSVVNAVLLQPLPYRDSGRLVWMTNYFPRSNSSITLAPVFIGWREQNTVFEEMAAYFSGDFNVSGGGMPERVGGARVTANVFSVLGAQPALGRTFLPEEDRPGGPSAVILGHALWQRRFGGDSNAIGRPLVLDGNPFTVVGVMPPTFQFPDELKAELFIPATLPAKVDWHEQLLFVVQAIARLKPGITLERAGADLSVINQRLIAESPIPALARSEAQIKLLSLHKKLVGDVRPALLLLFGSVCLVLLVACANVANLQLARAATRHKEMAVRAALGAARRRLARQLITESLLVTAIGGAFGILICHWSMDLLRAFTAKDILFVQTVKVDGWVLVFTFLVVAVIGILSGLAPALVASKPDLNETLQQGSPRFAGGHGRVRSLLVVFQLALTVVLLVGWGLLIRSFVRLTRVDPGFDPRNVLTAKLERSEGNDSEARLREFFEQLLERVQALPGVQSVGATSHLPLAGYYWLSGVSGYTKLSTVTVEGRARPAPGQSRPIPLGVVSTSYFQTMGIPLLAGRHFGAQDGADTPGVAIINEASARRFFPDEGPIGRRVQIDSQQGSWLSVVGVVRDVKHLGLHTEPLPEIYVPYLQYPLPFLTLVVRTRSDPKALVHAIRAQVFSLDKDLPVYDIATLQERIKESVAPRLHNLWLLGIFAALALILAAVGVYGMMAYSVAQRTQEIGVRIALGAEPHDVLKLVVKQGVAHTFISVGVGLTVALALTRVLSSFLFGVTATDPVTFAGVSVLLSAVALLACYIPAHRATKVDPMVALRHE